jgi:hypothetical protein
MQIHSPSVLAAQHFPSELDRLGDEIAELSAHLDGSAAGRCAGPARGDGPPSRARPRRPGRALPGGGPRRRPRAGRTGSAGPVGRRARRARFRGTDHVATATPRRPETQYDRTWRVQRSITLLVPIEPDAEPDPGRCEVPHRVAAAQHAVSTHQETLLCINAPLPPERR